MGVEKKRWVDVVFSGPYRIVKIFLDSPDIQLLTRRIHGSPHRVLRVTGGEAGFGPGGAVHLRIPGNKILDPWRALARISAVLEIRDSNGKVLARNHCLCGRCYTNTGEEVSRVPGQYWAQYDVAFKCSTCGRRWTRKNI